MCEREGECEGEGECERECERERGLLVACFLLLSELLLGVAGRLSRDDTTRDPHAGVEHSIVALLWKLETPDQKPDHEEDRPSAP